MIDYRLFENPITVFISYNELFRFHNEFIIKTILNNNNLKNQLKDYINLDIFSSQSESRIRVLILNRTKQNLLEWLSVNKFNYELNYQKMYTKFQNMFINSFRLKMYNVISEMLTTNFIDKIFIYNPIKDIRMMYDIVSSFGKNDKIKYVTGPYLKVINTIEKIDLFIDNDIERLSDVIRIDEYKESVFMIARYGYNYEYNNGLILKNNITDYTAKKKIVLAEFLPFDVTYTDTLNG